MGALSLLVFIGTLAWVGVVVWVRTGAGFVALEQALADSDAVMTALGGEPSLGWWTGVQLDQAASGQRSVAVRVTASGPSGVGTVHAELVGDGVASLLLDVSGEVIDVLEDNDQAGARAVEQAVVDHVGHARRLLDDGALDEAAQVAALAVATDPRSVPAWTIQGEVAVAQGELSVAGAAVGRALSLAPLDPGARLGRALLEQAQDDAQACIETATGVVKDSPRLGRAWTIRAGCVLDTGDRRTALAGARQGCRLGSEAGCALAEKLSH